MQPLCPVVEVGERAAFESLAITPSKVFQASDFLLGNPISPVVFAPLEKYGGIWNRPLPDVHALRLETEVLDDPTFSTGALLLTRPHCLPRQFPPTPVRHCYLYP